MNGALGIDRITVRYGSTLAVNEVSETVADGEWVALIGANGAGKSSLLRAVAHLERHDGTVTVGGVPTARLTHKRRARLVAYVPQKPEVPVGMTAFEYTLLGRTPHLGYLGDESLHDRRYCLDLLDRMGLADMAARRLPTLSGGELQRVVLARALAQEAPVLVLDEPTSALDLGRRVEVLELVDSLRRERGLTVLSALHDLTLAAQFADRLVLLSAGTVRASGRAADVLEEKLLSSCFGGSVRVVTDEDGALYVVGRRAGRTSEQHEVQP